MKKTFTLFCILSASIAAHAQADLFCVRNSSTFGGFAYCEIDLPNDTVYDKTLLPGYIGSLFVSTTADAMHSVYYACDGQRLFGVNTITDSVVLNLQLPLGASDYMTTIQYNPCDSTIYGLFTTSSSNSFSAVCSFRPSDSLFTANLASVANIYHSGQQGAIDPGNNIYYFENGSTSTSFIGGYDITQNAVLFNTQVSPLNLSLLFRGIRYDCDSARVIGLEIDQSLQQTHLATVDVLSGALTHISPVPAANTFYFSLGGATLDHTTGTFYYSSGQASISTFDNSGSNYTNDTLPVSGMVGIETMSGCTCSVSTGIMEEHAIVIATWPNPFTETVSFSGVDLYNELVIYNSLGAIVYRQNVNSDSVTIDGSAWPAGLYTYHFKRNGGSANGTFVKE